MKISEDMIIHVDELKNDDDFWKLLFRHSNLIQKFFRLTHGTVSVVDEHGDYNWDALYKEIAVVVRKIAADEQIRIDQDELQEFANGAGVDRYATFDKWFTDPLIIDLAMFLDVEFRHFFEAFAGESLSGETTGLLSPQLA